MRKTTETLRAQADMAGPGSAQAYGDEPEHAVPLDEDLPEDIAAASRSYRELTRLIERLHRRFLDVLRAELNRLGVRDLNSVQALLLANIGDEAIAIRDLVERGYYQGSNVSYNIKKLTDMGYLAQERSEHDRRSVTVELTEKARKVVVRVKELEQSNAVTFAGYIDEASVGEVCSALRRLERTWADYIHYGAR